MVVRADVYNGRTCGFQLDVRMNDFRWPGRGVDE